MVKDNKHSMMECIKEEPEVIRKLFEERKEITKDFVDLFLHNPIKKAYLSGHGSSLNDGLMIKPFMEKILKIEVTVTNPTTFNERESFNVNGVYSPNEMVVMCPAHGGSTTGPIITARKAKAQGIPVICTTYDTNSLLAKECEIVIDKKTPKEDAFVETRGHISATLIFYLCALEAALALGRISEDEYFEWCRAFEELPNRCEDVIKATEEWYEKNKYMLISSKIFTIIGFAENYAVAIEGGLKIAEATVTASLPFEMEEFMHGPMLSVKSDSVIFFLNPKANESKRMHHLLRWCRQHSKYCVLVANNDDPEIDDISLHADFLDKEYLTVFEYVIPFQMIAHMMAMDMGLSTLSSYHPGAGKQLGIRMQDLV